LKETLAAQDKSQKDLLDLNIKSLKETLQFQDKSQKDSLQSLEKTLQVNIKALENLIKKENEIWNLRFQNYSDKIESLRQNDSK
jgi:hypothetical protein